MLFPCTAWTGASVRNRSTGAGQEISPACRITSTDENAAITWRGRKRARSGMCVSEMTPIFTKLTTPGGTVTVAIFLRVAPIV